MLGPRDHGSAPTRSPEWTAETIERFWNYWTSRKDCDDWYFSHKFGQALIHCARWFGVLNGEVLDYGFSRGLFLPRLLNEAIGVTGVEFSADAVAAANARHAGRPNWRGAVEATSLPTPLPDAGFDLIYCVEVYEHLIDAWLDTTTAELRRLLKPGGHAIVTTPYREELGRHLSYCPFCTAEFHLVQHVRTVTPEWLAALFARHGFEIAFCGGVDLENFQQDYTLLPVTKWRPFRGDPFRRIGRTFGHGVRRLRDRRTPGGRGTFEHIAAKPGPHLLAIVRKPGTA